MITELQDVAIAKLSTIVELQQQTIEWLVARVTEITGQAPPAQGNRPRWCDISGCDLPGPHRHTAD